MYQRLEELTASFFRKISEKLSRTIGTAVRTSVMDNGSHYAIQGDSNIFFILRTKFMPAVLNSCYFDSTFSSDAPLTATVKN